MNEGRLYIQGRLRHRNLTKSIERSDFITSSNTRIPVPNNTIFISHQSRDSQVAEAIAQYLGTAGHDCYLDTMDPKLDGDNPYLEVHIRATIKDCLALLAVISPSTKDSWWVPLEIGVALEREKHIASYLLTKKDLPSYLWHWPAFESNDNLIKWANQTNFRTPQQANEAWRSLSLSVRMSS